MNFRLILASILTVSTLSVARTPAPLLAANPRSDTGLEYRVKNRAKRPITRHTDAGGELGVQGRQSNATGGLLGMQGLIGARGFLRLPVGHAYYLTPTAGFFYGKQGEGNVSFEQKIIELGLTPQWAFSRSPRHQLLLGVANRLEFHLTKVSAGTLSASNPLALRYRVGPTVGGVFAVSNEASLVVNTEGTFTFADGGKFGAGVTAGVLFHLN